MKQPRKSRWSWQPELDQKEEETTRWFWRMPIVKRCIRINGPAMGWENSHYQETSWDVLYVARNSEGLVLPHHTGPELTQVLLTHSLLSKWLLGTGSPSIWFNRTFKFKVREDSVTSGPLPRPLPWHSAPLLEKRQMHFSNSILKWPCDACLFRARIILSKIRVHEWD